MALTRLDNLYSSKTGKYLYVSPDDFNATDELDNRGNSPLRPFKTIQRAFIEVARYSYLPGSDNDRFDQFSIMLMPGDHYIDNRPGLVNIDRTSRQRYYDARNLIQANRQEIIDRAFAEIAIQYDEVAWGNDWVVPGDDPAQAKSRYYDAYRLIQKNRQEIIDRSVAQISIDSPDFYYPDDPQETEVSRYKDAYRLIQNNRDFIVIDAWNATVALYPGIGGTELKCKRDLGYFIDAISLDVHTGGNTYTRQFLLKYFDGTDQNSSFITNGIENQIPESVFAFTQAAAFMKQAVTNLYVHAANPGAEYTDLTISVGESVYGDGQGDLLTNQQADACADVQSNIDNLLTTVTVPLIDGNLVNLAPLDENAPPSGEAKCKRDLGYIIDYVSLDVAQGGGNEYTRKVLQNYFDSTGTNWIDDGLQGETTESVIAFEKARDVMVQAITNQLYYKDLTITADIGADPLLGNQDPANCSDIQQLIINLITTVVDTVNNETLVGLPAEDLASDNPGETKCKRDIGYIVDAIAADLQNGGNGQIIAATKAYFDESGVPINDGLAGEEAQSVVAFNKARDLMQQAITNQLLSKDLTLLTGPAEFSVEGPIIPLLPSGNAASCVDVQTTIADLISIITETLIAGDLSGLAVIQITGDVPIFNYNQSIEEWNDNTILDLSNPDNALYKFNASTGGAIVPRGCSLIGYDLRRTIVRPLYVPDPVDATQERTSIFNLTGGCYLWQFTIKDGDLSTNSPLYDTGDRVGKVYYQKGNNTTLATPEYSHHKICIMTYADEKDLDEYYEKVGRSFSLYQPTIDDGDLEALVQENRIVGPLSDTRNIVNIRLEDNVDTSKVTVVVTTKIAHGYFKDQYVAIIDNGLNDLLNGTFKVIELDDTDPRIFKYELNVTELQVGLDLEQDYDFNTVPPLDLGARVQAEIDSVESASPYVFNCSIRSTWGQCGMWADGSKATGFKSMVVAQYTGVSLQRDDRAFIRYDEFTNTWNQASITDAFATEPYHTRGDAYWKDDWRNFHIRASDDAFIQCVSVFAVGFFDHFLMESGGDMSITNSNSNFGNTSLHSIGFKGFAFNQDKGGYITDIVPVKTVDDSAFNETQLKYYSLDAQVTKDASNTTGRLYYGSDDIYDPFTKPAISIDGYRLGAKTGDKIFLKLKGTTGTTETYEAALTNTGFQRYTTSLSTLNPDGLSIDNLAQDASSSIENNKLFIQQEGYGYIIEKYPYLLDKPGIEIGKCERDIGYFVDAVVQDLRVGGNIQTIQAAEAYFIGGSLTYIPGELNETLDALNYVKQLCIAAMRNYDYLIRNCTVTQNSAIVDVGDTSGLLIGMEVVEYEYTATNFENGRLLPGAVPVTVNNSVPTGTYIKNIIDETRIELGQVGSKINSGNSVLGLNSNIVYLYFSLPQTGNQLDPDNYLSGAWAAQPAVKDNSIIQDNTGGNPPAAWDVIYGDGYPECVNIANTIDTYFDDISVILNQGLQSISSREESLATLILANKNLAAEEALDRAQIQFPSITLSDQLGLINDVKLTIDAYAYNIQYGGNSKVYDRGSYYVANPSVTNNEELFTRFLYDEVTNILQQVVLQDVVIIANTGITAHGIQQIFDQTIIGDASQVPGVYDPNDFADVRLFLDNYAQLVNDGIGTDVLPGDITAYTRTEPVVGASVGRVDPTVNTANLATRATLFTINTGNGTTDPHNWETGTPVRLIPKARAGTNPDKRVVRLPRGFETNTVYYVIAPGRATQPEDYSNGLVYPGIFEADSKTKVMLARTKDNAAAGIYIYSSETDSVDPDVEIEIQQYVLDVKYDLHQYLCNLVTGQNDVLQTDVPHVFDIPGTGGPVHKVFFRTFGDNSSLPQFSTGPVDPNTYYYIRYVTSKTFSVFLTEAEAISGANPQIFTQGFGNDFYVLSDKRRSPVKFDAELVTTNTTTGQWYIQTIPDLGNTSNIIDRLQTLGAQLTDSRTKNTYFTRLNDSREKEDRVYRLRYVIPRYATGVRDPLNGFVIKARTDETRKLLPQRILLQSVGPGAPVATFNVPVVTGQGTVQQQLGLPIGDPGLIPDFDYDPYNISQVKVIDSDRSDSKISFSILSARQVDIGGVGDPLDLRLELTVFNHGINNNALKNEKFVTVKIDAPQGGTFRSDSFQAVANNRITWSGNSRGAGYLQGYFNPDGTNDHYLVIKAIESQNDIEYNRFVPTKFAQPVLDGDNDPTFDINGNPIEIFATLQAKPNSVGNEALSKSAKEDYLYSNKDANVLTMVPGDVIEDDTTADYEIVSVEDVGDFEDSFYIFDIDEIQRRIPNQQEGIYYLTCLKGNVSPYPTGPGVGENFRNFKFSQPISTLYPLDYKNDPLWFQVQPDGTRDDTIIDPPSTICAADNYVHGLVTTNDYKNSQTKEAIEDLIANPALSRYNYTIEAQSGNATSGSEDRRISISGDSIYPTENRLFVELRRPSIARSGNHTFEYLGFGPGNYSTGFPLRQEVVLSDIQDFYAQSKKEDAGIVFYTGLNSNGDLYIGNKKVNAITGEETFLESAELVSSDDEGGDLGGLVTTFELPVVFERDITVDGDANFNNPVTINVEPSEPPALTIISNVDFAQGGDQSLDSTSFVFSDIPSAGNIIASKNSVYSAIFALNPRGNTTLSGQNYSIRTHADQTNGNTPTNHTPNQENSSLGLSVLFGNEEPKSGDILFRGQETGRTGSIGWIYSNYYTDQTLSVNSIQGFDSFAVRFYTIPGTTPADIGIVENSIIKLSGFSGRFNNINGIRTAINVAVDSFEIIVSFLISSDPGDPTALVSLSGNPKIEVSSEAWKEFGLFGAEALRTLTDNYGDFRLGINTLARASHGPGGDQEEGFVNDSTVAARANLDVVGTTFISGRVLETTPNDFVLNQDPANRTFLNVDNAFLVGGDSDTPGNVSTFRISTTNNGRVGINVPFADLDKTFVVIGDMRVSEDITFESNLQIQGENLTTTSQTFNLIPSVATNVNFAGAATNLNIANLTTSQQEINIGNVTSTQTLSIGQFSTNGILKVHSGAASSLMEIGTVPNNVTSNVSVIELGGAYANNSDDLIGGSILKVYNRYSYFDGDVRIGQALNLGTGTASLQSNALTFNLFTTTTTNLNIGLSSSSLSIGALGGTTTINNSLEVLSETTLFGDTVLRGGLNAGQFEIRRGSFGVPTTLHEEGNEVDDFNIDIYQKTEIPVVIDTDGAGSWGGSAFKDLDVLYASDPSVYVLPLNQPSSALQFEPGSFVLVDRSKLAIFGPTLFFGNITASANQIVNASTTAGFDTNTWVRIETDGVEFSDGTQFAQITSLVGTTINLSKTFASTATNVSFKGGVSTQGTSPVGQKYSELCQVIGIINLSDVGPDALAVRVRRARNQVDAAGDMFIGPDVDGNAANYRYLRTDHPDNAVLIRYDFAANVSYLDQDLTALPSETEEIVSTGSFSGSIGVGDIFRLSSDANSNLGELAEIVAVDQVSNQTFIVDDGGTPAVIAMSVDSVTGNTYINGELTVNKSIILDGTSAPDSEILVIRDGLGNSNSDKFIVDSYDGETSIRGNVNIGEDNFDRVVIESDTGTTTITEGNLIFNNDLGDQQLFFQNSSGNLTISGVIRTQGSGENIISGDLSIEGGDLGVFNMVDDGFGNLVREEQFAINNDGSMDFAGQTPFYTPSGARKWEYVGGGVTFVDAESNINYFVSPSTDVSVRLPQNPTHGDVIRIVDVGGRLTYNVSLRMRAPNGVRIQGDLTNSGVIAGLGSAYDTGGELIVQTPNASFGLVYLGSIDYKGTSIGSQENERGWWLLEI